MNKSFHRHRQQHRRQFLKTNGQNPMTQPTNLKSRLRFRRDNNQHFVQIEKQSRLRLKKYDRK